MHEPISAPSRQGDLRDARETERLGSYLGALWTRREWAWYVASSELRSRQINSFLGNLWHLLNPILQITVFFIFFGLVLDVRRGVDNFIGYLAVGIFTYTFTQRAVTAGGKSLTKYRGLIQIVSFPRALLPLTSTITESLAVIPAYIVMLTVALLTKETPGFGWLLIIPFFVLQVVFSAGAALVTARAVSHVADVQQVLPFIFRLGFYASGVLFNVNAYLEGSPWKVVFQLNPLYCFIEINRSILLSGVEFEPRLGFTALAWSFMAAMGGLIWFRRAEDTYGEG